MVSTYDQLFRASFKGVSFLPSGSITTSGGRKLTDHNYPNSDRRFIEDLGKKTNDFSITGIIQGPNYFAKRKRLIDVLEESGAGRLVHPFFGSINVVARPYSLTEDFTKVGEGRFTMSFSVPSKNIFPTSAGLTNIGSFIGDLRDSLNDLLTFDFDIGIGDVALATEELMNDVFDKFEDVSRKFAQLEDNVTTFQKIIDDARGDLPSLIRDTTQLNTFFNNVFDSINNLYNDPSDTFNMLKGLFSFLGGENKPETTAIRAQRNKNNDVVNIKMNSLALSNAYLNATLINYGNNEELEDVVNALNDQFDGLIDSLEDPVATDLYIVRDTFDQFKDDTLLSLDEVVTINTAKTSVLELAYRYYGSTEKEDDVASLNNTLNPSNIEGEYQIIKSIV